MQVTRAFQVICACVVLSSACSGDSAGTRAADPAVPGTAAEISPEAAMEEERTTVPAELVGSWTLVAIDGQPVPQVGKTPTLEILEDGSAAGVSGVNRFRTTIDTAGGRLSFGPVALTKMAGPPAAMELESTFMELLGAATGYRFEGDSLRIVAGDTKILSFEKTTAEEE